MRNLYVALRAISYSCQHDFDAGGVFGTSEDVTCVDGTTALVVGSIVVDAWFWLLGDVVQRKDSCCGELR